MPEESRIRKIKLPPVMVLFGVAIVLLMGFSWFYAFVMRKVAHAGFPYNAKFFGLRGDLALHWDFEIFRERFLHFGTPSFWQPFHYPFTYPAASAVVFGIFYKLPHAAWAYLCLCAGVLAIAGWFLAKALQARGASGVAATVFILTAILTSWPLQFLLQRANIEGVVAILTGAAILCVFYRRWMPAATLIGLAGAMKIFPLVLLGLLLAKRRYRAFAWGLMTAVVATVVSLELLGPNIREAQRHITAGLSFFEHTFAAQADPGLLPFDHSPLTLVKVFLILIFWHDAAGSAWIALRVYTPVAALFGVAVYFLAIRRLPLLNQALALTLCMVLLPPISFDYTLTHLLVPFGLLCLYETERWQSGRPRSRGVELCFGLFALIFTDMQYMNYHFRLGGQFRCVVMIVLLIAVLRCPMPWGRVDGGALPAGAGA